MTRILAPSIAIALAIASGAPQAQAQGPGAGCTTLSEHAEATHVRFMSGPGYLLIRDGEARYRVDLFRRDDGAFAGPWVRINSNGMPRTLCTDKRTTIKSDDGRVFWASRVKPMAAEEFDRRVRLAMHD